MENATSRGVHAAVLTPLSQDLSIDIGLLARHGRDLLSGGCHGLVLFGTTGDGPSFSVDERMAALDALIAADIPPDRILVATGCAALPDTVRLSRHALGAGCPGVLVMPPFFFKDVSDEGVFGVYSHVIDAVDDPRMRLVLYNFPAMSGVTIAVDVVARLIDRYPVAIAGLKDSSGNWAYQMELRDRIPELPLFCGHETLLPRLMARGGSGAISGLANVVPGLVRHLFDEPPKDPNDPATVRMTALVELLDDLPLTPAIRTLAGHVRNEPDWRRVRPPLVPLDEAQERRLLAAFDEVGGDSS